MPLEIEHRPSPSPYVERVWRSRSAEIARMMSVATPRWSLVFWEQGGRRHACVQGPESRASHAPVPEDATFVGIDFAIGSTMPRLPVGRIVDGNALIPDVTCTSFWLDGSSWHIPDFDNAEAFVGRLVRDGVVVGPGKRLFGEGTTPGAWELVESASTATGVTISTYRRRGPLEVGAVAAE